MDSKNNSMGLWLKFLLQLSEKQISWIAFVVLIVSIPVLFMSIALLGVTQVEDRYARLEVDQATMLIQNEIDRVDLGLLDWSAWNDTYEFAVDHNQSYLDNNINAQSINNLGIDFMLLVDKDKNVLIARHIDRATITETALPFDLKQLFTQYPALFQHTALDSHLNGIVLLNGRAMLIASRPVTTSNYEGPIHGTLVFGAWLENEASTVLTHLTRREIFVHPLSDVGISVPARPTVAPGQSAQPATVIRPVDSNIIAGYQFLDDLNHQPAAVMQINLPRELYKQGLVTASLFLVASLLVGGVLFSFFQPLALTYHRSTTQSREYLERFQKVVEQSSDAILTVSPDLRILDANPAGLQLLGLKNGETVPGNLKNILTFNTNFDEALLESLSQSGKKNEQPCKRRDDVLMVLEISASRLTFLNKPAYSLMLHDITSHKNVENALRASEERYQLATRGANDGLWDWNLMTDEIYYSVRWKAMLGYEEDEIGTSPYEWFDRIHPEDRVHVKTLLSEHLNNHSEHFESEHRVLHKDGHYRWMLVRGVAVWNQDGYAHRIAGSQTDITERKNMEEQLRYDALHDGLTGLANRTLLLDRIKHVNERKRRIPEMVFAVFFLDFDRFKQINDTMGHQYGDQLLVEASRRLETCMRSADTVARFSGPETLARIAGDEFVVLLEDFHSVQDVYRVADRVLTLLSRTFMIEGKELNVGVSMGIVIPDRAYDDPEEIIRNADLAMYSAKQRGGSRMATYTEDMFEKTAARVQLENELRRAVENWEFKLVYHPIFSLPDDSVIGFEALLRWQHPQAGEIMPSDFIDVAEETGLIIPIGYRVLEEACRKVRSWQEKYKNHRKMIVSVNLSTRQLIASDLVERIRIILETVGFDPQYLWLEVTENTLIHNLHSVQTTLRVLRNMGIQIKIDDFGTGYSSFSYLQHLPVDGFKIDRSFIHDLNGKGQQIVDVLISLGHNLGLKEVAEGVETVAQKEFLRELSCDYFQGFLMSEPLNEQDAEAFICDR